MFVNDCYYLRETQALIDGSLPAVRQAVVEEHLNNCAICGNAYRTAHQLTDFLHLNDPAEGVLREVSAPATAELRSELLARCAATQSVGYSTVPHAPRRGGWVWAGAAVAAVSLLAVIVMTHHPEQQLAANKPQSSERTEHNSLPSHTEQVVNPHPAAVASTPRQILTVAMATSSVTPALASTPGSAGDRSPFPSARHTYAHRGAVEAIPLTASAVAPQREERVALPAPVAASDPRRLVILSNDGPSASEPSSHPVITVVANGADAHGEGNGSSVTVLTPKGNDR